MIEQVKVGNSFNVEEINQNYYAKVFNITYEEIDSADHSIKVCGRCLNTELSFLLQRGCHVSEITESRGMFCEACQMSS